LQLSTHFVCGVLIDTLVTRTKLTFPLRIALVASMCYLSHGILDKLARATYHPPDPLNDGFWEPYHKKFLPALTWAVSLAFGKKHAFAMLCSALPDLDWVVRGFSRKYNRQIPGWDQPILNEGLHAFWDQVPLVNRLNHLPDLRFNPKGALIEVGLVVNMLGCIFILKRQERINHANQS
jgi:hypothetical protein